MDVILFTFISAAIITFLLNFQKWWASYQRDKIISQIPGPRRWPIVGSLIPFIKVARHERFKVYKKFAEMYKHNGFYLVWVGNIPEVRITKCEHAEQIFKSSKHIEKSPTYRFIESWLGKGLITSTGQHWFTHRRLLTPAFHYSILEDFCEVFGENANVLVKELSETKVDQEFDIYPHITKTALDVICETAMGIKLRTLPDNDYIKAVYEYCEVQLHRFFKPWLRPNFIFNLTKMGPIYKKSIDILQGMTRKVIKERKQFRANLSEHKLSSNDVGMKTKKAFLDLLLDVSNENEHFTEQDIIDEVNTFMFAGHDTTSVGICWALFMIGSHPEIQEKIYEEMQSIFGDDRTRVPTYQELNDMKYLERCIKETLRIRPSVPNISRKLSEDIELNGYKLPAGAFVALNIFFMHHDERYFPEPEKFDPDRFLPEHMEKRHSYAFVPFSAGPRNCIGQRFALLEEKSLISAIVRNFKITSLQKAEDIHLIAELVLRPHEGIKMKFEKRT